MKPFNLGSISKNLAFLVILAVLPALAILIYNGLDQRRHSIEQAKRDVLFLTGNMAHAQKNLTRISQQVLSTLALLPDIQNMHLPACKTVLAAVLEKNPVFQNIALTALNGEVLASGLPTKATSLADRKHFREALQTRDFAVGEYIVSRVGKTAPAFAYAYPVLDPRGQPRAVLTTAINLNYFSRFYDTMTLPEKSFVAVTDHRGIRLLYYPPKETNPIGKPIKAGSWEVASQAREPGSFIETGSDGIRRVFAYQQVRLSPDRDPYIYLWAGIPEDEILTAAHLNLNRNLLLMLLAIAGSLLLSWLLARRTLISPLESLVAKTRRLALGGHEVSREQTYRPGEIGGLSKAFDDMADAVSSSQAALRESEARFRLIMDSLDALVYVADMESYEILFINEFGRREFGDVTGGTCWQSLQTGMIGPCSFCTNKYLLTEDGQPAGKYTWEFLNTHNGHWYHIHDRAIKWTDGRTVRLEIATDISEIKLAENRLAEETERLAVTLKSIGDGVITTDTRGRVVLINRVAEALTGWKSHEATGRPLSDVFTRVNEETGEQCQSPVDHVLASGETISLAGQTALLSKDGQHRIVADCGAPIRDETGEIIGAVLVFRDITDQLRTEQELIKIKKLESIGVLAGGIAHDFNNILAAILGNIDLSLRDTNLSERTRRLLRQALGASTRARDLTQQLLTFAKGGEPIKEVASLAEVVRDSADFILRGDKVACRYLFPDDLWLVDIDKGQISQVVQNIILNASNAMPDGGSIEVSCENFSVARSRDISTLRDADYIKLDIRDTGIGIPANLLAKIFDPYFSTKQQGSGLGLAITHSIVTKHGGSISVLSTPGNGSTFTIYLPASEQQSTPAWKDPGTELGSTKVRILLMDDEEIVRDTAQEMLTEMGHEVLLARDGMEAIRIYREAMEHGSPIDLLIMDLTVPGGMGGTETMLKILTIDKDAKGVVSSGYSNDPVMANCQDYGFRSAIVKPYQLEELSQVVNQLID